MGLGREPSFSGGTFLLEPAPLPDPETNPWGPPTQLTEFLVTLDPASSVTASLLGFLPNQARVTRQSSAALAFSSLSLRTEPPHQVLRNETHKGCSLRVCQSKPAWHFFLLPAGCDVYFRPKPQHGTATELREELGQPAVQEGRNPREIVPAPEWAWVVTFSWSALASLDSLKGIKSPGPWTWG